MAYQTRVINRKLSRMFTYIEKTISELREYGVEIKLGIEVIIKSNDPELITKIYKLLERKELGRVEIYDENTIIGEFYFW